MRSSCPLSDAARANSFLGSARTAVGGVVYLTSWSHVVKEQ